MEPINSLLTWVGKHWPELLAAFGLGSGGGFAAKKFADREQDEEIQVLKKDILELDRNMTRLENEIAVNTAFDKQFRNQVEKEHLTFKSDMQEVKGRLDKILDHLLNKK